MRKLFSFIHQSWLLVALMIGIIVGTILSVIFRISVLDSPLFLILVAILFIFSFFRPNYMMLIVVFLAGMILAGVRTSVELKGEEFIGQAVGQNIELTGEISEDPDEDTGGVKIKLNKLEIEGIKTSGSVFVQMSRVPENLERGDMIKIKGEMSEGFGTYAGYFYKPEIIEHKKPEPQNMFLATRNWLSERIKKYIPEKESKLGLAYLLGMKSGLDDEMMEILRIVGLTHIVVASGTHLSIITEFVKKIFGKLSRFAGMLFSILFIVGFGWMIGWTASITRAAIVTVLTILATYVGRKFEAWRIILLSMAITLLISPMYLVNLGWLLSFGSFIGILIFAPEIQKFFFGEEKVGKLAEIIIATISAQLLTIPIILYFFGSISLISVVANLLILPTIAIVMGLCFFTGILAFPIIGDVLGFLSKILLDYHITLMEFFAEQKMFLVEMPAENPMVFLLYVIIIMPFIYTFIKRICRERKRNML